MDKRLEQTLPNHGDVKVALKEEEAFDSNSQTNKDINQIAIQSKDI